MDELNRVKLSREAIAISFEQQTLNPQHKISGNLGCKARAASRAWALYLTPTFRIRKREQGFAVARDNS